MRNTSPAHQPRRSRTVRRLTTTAAAAGLLLAALPSGAALADGHRTWVVEPGESIQAAVDRASSGDTVQIEAGTYQEAVCVDGKGLTVVGAGRDSTSIVWPDWSSPADLPEVGATPCWEAENASARQGDPATLADDVSGLFFLDPDGPVRVQGLSTRNHPADGIAAWGATGFRVSKTAGYGHGRYGVLAAASSHTRISRTIEQGVDRGAAGSGIAGVGITDSGAAYADVTANDIRGYNLGVFAREARTGVVRHNYVAGNCIGVLVLDDHATEVPGAERNVRTGDWQVYGNESTANDRVCSAGPAAGPPAAGGPSGASGVGMAVVDADTVSISGNTIGDNVPATDPAGLGFPSGGLVLVSTSAPDTGSADGVSVRSNGFSGNAVDVALRGVGNADFRGNTCTTSNPAGICPSS
jgi:hypothetical protein